MNRSSQSVAKRAWRSQARALIRDRHELVNTITHGMGFALAAPTALLLVFTAATRSDALSTIGCAIYGVSLILVFGASTLSHAVQNPGWKHRFRILDQAFIYLLISGTFTPFAFRYLNEGWWWALSGAMWIVAIGGCVSKLIFEHRIRGVSVAIYLALGWLPVTAVWPIIHATPMPALQGVLLGGLSYTLGTVFLVLDKEKYYFHAIWHVLVIFASAVHALTIYRFVALG